MKKLILIIISGGILVAAVIAVLLLIILPFRLNEARIDANVDDVVFPEQKSVASVVKNDFTDYTVEAAQWSCGLLRVSDIDGKEGVYSLSESALIVPVEADVTITFQTNIHLGCYIRVLKDTTGEEAWYDVNGNVVIANDEYLTATISVDLQLVFDDFGKLIDTEYYEEISVLTQSDFDDGVLEPTIVTYKVNVEEQTRAVHTEEDETFKYGDKFSIDTAFGVALDRFGFDDHVLIFAGDVFSVVSTEDNTVMSSFIIPMADVHSITFIEGKIIYQILYQVDNNEEEYTYIEPGMTPKKFILRSVSVDMKNGRQSELDLDFLINGFEPFSNAKGIFTHAVVTINPISNKMLVKEIDYEYIMSSRGKLLIDVTVLRLTDLERLNEDYIFNPTDLTILDNELNVVTRIPGDHNFIYAEEIIVFRIGNSWGAIDYAGNVVIAFEHDNLSLNFVDGETYGWDDAFNHFGIDLENNKNTILGDVVYLGPGALLRIDTTTNTAGNYGANIIGYSGNVYQSFEMINTTPQNINHINNAYASFSVVRVLTPDGVIFYSIVRE